MNQQAKSASYFSLGILVAILSFFWIGLSLDWDRSFWWYDNVLHFAGGLWVASIFEYFIYRLELAVINRHFWVKLILGLGFVALIGVLWEFHEYLADIYLRSEFFQSSIKDTVSDLTLDLLGGLLFLLWRILGDRKSSVSS